MIKINTIKTKCPAAYIIAVFFVFPFTASAGVYDGLPADYVTAINNARTHIDHPSGWIPTDGSIITITGNPTTENPSYGLTYNSSFGDGNNYLVVRTLTNVGYYTSSGGALRYGVGAYTTYDDNPTKYQRASWVTTGNDATKFIDTNVTSPASLVTTMERGLGMNNINSHTAIVEYGVLPNDNNLMRPTLNPDISSYPTTASSYGYSKPFTPNQPSGMSNTTYNYLKNYLDYWQSAALGNWHASPVVDPTSPFPWSQLGYTYFWGNGDALNQIKGMSEFIILGGTAVKIIGIYSPESYLYTKNKNGVFSTDSNAEYGNGFASFNVTGNCDTIWAGNAFQVNASSDPGNPNQIIIAGGSTISGGQGILVWSSNYTVTNYGTMSGATANKLSDLTTGGPGLANTSNIAILFKGDTSYGDPGGKNILINSGSISSDPLNPSTAVEADAANTQITNSGIISGYTYGIHLLSGTNTITNTGTISATGGAVGAAAIQIDSGTTAVNSTGGSIIGNVVLANNATAALDVGNAHLSVTGAYVQNSNSTLKLTADSAANFGTVTAPSASTLVASDSRMIVTIGGYIPNNTILDNVVSGAGSSGIDVPATIASSSPIFTFSGANGTGDHLSVTASRANSYNSFATNANSSAVGGVLNTIAMSTTASGGITNLLGALDSLGSGHQIDQALSALTPNVDNSCPQTNYETQTRFINTAIDHINTVFQGVAASSGRLDPAVWAEPFGMYLHQAPRGTSDGYSAAVGGILGGYDSQVSNDLAFGVSAGYARDEIRADDFNGRTGVDSYQLGLYGSFTRSAYYIDGIFSLAYNRYDASREINFGGLGLTAASNYGGEQYSSYFEGGYNFDLKKLEITPLASIEYMRLNIDGYTEKNAGAADLTVDNQGYNLLQSGLGAKIAYTIEEKNFTLVPDFHFKWLYNFINDNQQATSTFAQGGASFVTSGFNLPASSYDIGTQWTIRTGHNISVSLNYDYEVRPGFYSHTGYINVRREF